MKAVELIKQLAALVQEYGNLDVEMYPSDEFTSISEVTVMDDTLTEQPKYFLVE